MLQNERAIISWATAMEENTNEFIVEYSVSGNDFKALGQILAAGSSSSSQTYSLYMMHRRRVSITIASSK
jgi:hypothetical protein